MYKFLKFTQLKKFPTTKANSVLKHMLKLKSNELKLVPFEAYHDLNQEDLLKQAEEHQLNLYGLWMLPQISAYFGTWQAVPLETGLLDPKATARYNIKNSWDIGLWRVVTQLKRGALVKTQSSEWGRNYSQLVPLILAGQKRHQGIAYQRWELEGLDSLVHKELLEVMQYSGDCLSLGSDRLIEIRNFGLTARTGVKSGQQNKPTSQWKLHGLQATPFAGAPTLLSTIMCQIWVAHPSLRTELMILDPENWDQMPKPLVVGEVFGGLGSKEKTNVKMPQGELKLPWED
jgi:hypothetical protein